MKVVMATKTAPKKTARPMTVTKLMRAPPKKAMNPMKTAPKMKVLKTAPEKAMKAEKTISADPALLNLLGDRLLTKKGDARSGEVLAGKKHVMIYFSAHWCPPCKAFTPVLAAAYKKSSKAGRDTEIVFASSDKDPASFDRYYKEMPWAALRFGGAVKKKLSGKFGIKGIPTLVVLDGKGKVVTKDGRSKYQTYL